MSGGNCCSVACCKSYRGKDKGISFFTFPKDVEIRNEWIRRCNRGDNFKPDNARICSLHFLPSDFERNLKAELMHLPYRKLLKPGVVPSLLLKPGDTVPTTTPQQKEAEHKEIVSMALKEAYSLLEVSSSQDVKFTPSTNRLLKQIDELKKENASLTLNLKNSHLEHERLTKHFECRIGSLQEVINSTESERNHFDAKVRELFSEQLSQNQLDIILKKKRMVKWTAQELSHAFSLRYFSKKGYAYLRNTLKYPLPGVSTLQKWIGSLNMRKGVLKEVLSFMNIMGESLNTIEKVTVLTFGEMKVNSIYEYDPKVNEVVGPYSCMQVVMARGLFSKWKQPIFIKFDTKMTPFILNMLIIELHNINFPVVACISDCDEGNVGLWGELGVTAENVSFSHPVTNKSIYMFADVPHLLQLTRNWLLDTGFILDDGRKISKLPLETLISQTTSEIKSSHGLKDLHINCEISQRQNVSLAVQLLSHTTAAALKSSVSGPEKELALNLSEFIDLFDRWFDIMNTSSLENLRKKPYRNTQEQNKVLNEIISTVGTMRCIGKDSLQTFQEGIIMSSTSLKKLFQDLKQEYNIKYILTCRLNQDILEDFFSQVRSREDLNDHPSPMKSINRIRMILFGNSQEVSEFSNTNCLEATEFVCATVLKTAQLTVKIEPSIPAQVLFLSEDFEAADSSCSMSSATQDRMPIEHQNESDAVKHLTQFIAEKFMKQEPVPENHTEDMRCSHDSSCLQQPFSLGRHSEPFQILSNAITSMEKRFQIFHKKGRIRPGKNIVKRTTAFINKKLNLSVDPEVVEEFSHRRIFLRLKYLNLSLQKGSLKRKTTEAGSGSAKKLKETIS